MLKKKSGKSKLISICLLLVCAAIVGFTGATVIHKLVMDNPIKTPTVTGKIEEDNDGNNKNASFTNEGTASVFLRVAYTESWSYKTDKGTEILLPNKIKQEDGTYKYMAQPNWEWNGKSSESSMWYRDENEQWIYYKTPLSPGDSTGLIVKEVDFSNVENANDERYKNAKYQLHFTLEVVQCSEDAKVSQDAIQAVFGKHVTLTNWPVNKTINWGNR